MNALIHRTYSQTDGQPENITPPNPCGHRHKNPKLQQRDYGSKHDTRRPKVDATEKYKKNFAVTKIKPV